MSEPLNEYLTAWDRKPVLRTVYTRTTKLPRTLHRNVRCGASRPKARLLLKSAVA